MNTELPVSKSSLKQSLVSLLKKGRADAIRFFGALFPTMSALGVQLVTFALTARGLGIEQFGQYNMILALSAVMVEIVGLGGADVLVRAVSKDDTIFPKYFGHVVMLVLVTLPIIAIGCTIWVSLFQDLPLPISAILLSFVAEILIARTQASCELVMVAHRQPVVAGWFRLAAIGMRLGAAVLYFGILGGADLTTWIYVVSAQSLIVAGLLVAFVALRYGRLALGLVHAELRSGLGFCINQTSRAAQSNMDRLVLSHFADATALGVYSAASRLMQVGMFPLQVATRITYPRFFVEGAKGFGHVRGYAAKVAPVFLGVGVCAGLAIAAAAWLLPIVLGKGFQDTTQMGVYLAFSLPLIALQYPAADALTGGGRQATRASIQICATLGFGFIMAIGAHVFGQIGLVVAFTSAQGLLAAILWTCLFASRTARHFSP